MEAQLLCTWALQFALGRKKRVGAPSPHPPDLCFGYCWVGRIEGVPDSSPQASLLSHISVFISLPCSLSSYPTSVGAFQFSQFPRVLLWHKQSRCDCHGMCISETSCCLLHSYELAEWQCGTKACALGFWLIMCSGYFRCNRELDLVSLLGVCLSVCSWG